MRNVLAIARRILVQFAHDKRTLGLLFVAPIVVLWLLTVLLGQGEYEPRLAAVDLPSEFEACLVEKNATVTIADMGEAERMLRANEVDAVLYCAGEEGDELVVWAEGSDSTKTSASLRVATEALADMRADAADRMKADVESKRAELEDLKLQAEQKRQDVLDRTEDLRATFDNVPDALKQQLGVSEDDLDIAAEFDDIEFPNLDDFGFDLSDYLPVSSVEVLYLHGNDEWKMFDFYGPVFIGIFLFVFVFITSGMSLVNERSAGTMKRFLATPVKPAEVLGGYTLGFGVLALVQSAIIVLIALTLIGFPCEGERRPGRAHRGFAGHRQRDAGLVGERLGIERLPGDSVDAVVRCSADSAFGAFRPFGCTRMAPGHQRLLAPHIWCGRLARNHAAWCRLCADRA